MDREGRMEGENGGRGRREGQREGRRRREGGNARGGGKKDRWRMSGQDGGKIKPSLPASFPTGGSGKGRSYSLKLKSGDVTNIILMP